MMEGKLLGSERFQQRATSSSGNLQSLCVGVSAAALAVSAAVADREP